MWSGNGIRLTFAKDLARKYDANQKYERESWQHQWHVFGDYDFLSCQPFKSLEDLSSKPTVRDGKASEPSNSSRFTPYNDFVLLAFDDEAKLPEYHAFCDQLFVDPPRNPLLAVVAISFSPGVYEFNPEKLFFEIFLHARTLLAKLAHEAGITFPVFHFCSLSGPELVLLSTPGCPEGLGKLQKLVRLARNLLLEDLKNAGSQGAKSLDEMPGHAFASITPTLAFNLSSHGHFDKTEFRNEEQARNLSYRFMLRVDCGHESAVQRDIAESANQNVTFFTMPEGNSWGFHSISGQFHHLADVITVITKRWFSETDDWRERHYIDSFTVVILPGGDSATLAELQQNIILPEDPNTEEARKLKDEFKLELTKTGDLIKAFGVYLSSTKRSELETSFKRFENCFYRSELQENGLNPEDANAETERAWKLKDDVKSELTKTGECIREFGARYLSATQCSELDTCFKRFESCFYRQDLVCGVRDLFPFFVQLGRALARLEEWDLFISKCVTGDGGKYIPSLNYNTLTESVDELISYLDRSVKNRVDQRSIQGDPPSPQSLPHGACKLVEAYTGLTWLLAEVFLRERVPPKEIIGFSRRYAACLRAGSSGTVVCTEAFADFRRFVERECKDRALPLTRITSNNDDEWNARLFLLDISGETLLKPAICFVHCMHEIAELADWIRLDRCGDLRTKLNKWLTQEIQTTFVSVLMPLPKKDEQTSLQAHEQTPEFKQANEQRTNVWPFAHWFVRFCNRTLYQSELPDAKPVEEMPGIEEYHPLTWIDAFQSYLPKVLRESIDSTFKLYNSFCSENHAKSARHPNEVNRFDYGSLDLELDKLREIAREVLADIGMMCCLEHLLSPYETRTVEVRCNDVCDIFESLIHARRSSWGNEIDSLRAGHLILLRWYVQLAATVKSDAAGTGEWSKQNVISLIYSRLERIAKAANRDKFAAKRQIMPLDKAKTYLNSLESDHPAIFRSQDPDNKNPDSLVRALRTLHAYQNSVQNEDAMFADLDGFNRQEQLIPRWFWLAWIEQRQGKNGAAQLNLAMALWMISQRLGPDQLLKSVS